MTNMMNTETRQDLKNTNAATKGFENQVGNQEIYLAKSKRTQRLKFKP